MAVVSRRLRTLAVLPMLLLFAVLLAVLVLIGEATKNAAEFDRLYSWLLISSSAGLLLLTLMIGRHLLRLIYSYRRREPGARLTARIVVVFIMISLAPVATVYYFSLQFLQEGIDSWFDVRVEEGLEDALELSRAALSLRMREAMRQTEHMSDDLEGMEGSLAALTLNSLLVEYELNELTLFDQGGAIVATANIDPGIILPNYPPEGVLLHVRQGNPYVGLEPVRDLGFYIRAMVKVANPMSPAEDDYVLQALFPVPDRLGELGDSVQAAFNDYKELQFLRVPLKASFILILSLVLLFGVLLAFWSALYASRRLVAPIQDLAEGTLAVAAGQYDRELPHSSNDELGFLVQSFNQMVRNLDQAWQASKRSQQLLEQQRAYLEVVLARLSSGVLTLSHEGSLRTYNQAACQILRVDLGDFSGQAIDDLCATHGQLEPLLAVVKPHLVQPGSDWRQEVTLFANFGRQVLMCRGSPLPDPVGIQGGHVIVFDDLTTLVRAERDAAWGEVARRLAHEIKNPLTPIQLSAERIRHKYLKGMEPEEARVLDRGTHTIIQQVQALKEMVDEFNDYARPANLRQAAVALNELVTEVMYLYRDNPTGIDIELDLNDGDLVLQADAGRLRQLVHNLVKNALEAIQEGQGTLVRVRTRRDSEQPDAVELSVADNGPGFPHSAMGDLFEPYVTTKARGSGLGLAIVKKIVEEHGGVISLGNSDIGGAQITIRFPINAAPEPRELSVLSSTEESG